MENLRIRQAAKEKHVRLWEVAEYLGMNDGNFSRKLRRELPVDETKNILAVIDSIHAQKIAALSGGEPG